MRPTTISKLKELGFTKSREYSHDEWHTSIYCRGMLIIEHTMHKPTGKLHTLETEINEVYLPVTIQEIKQLDKIINKSYGSKK